MSVVAWKGSLRELTRLARGLRLPASTPGVEKYKQQSFKPTQLIEGSAPGCKKVLGRIKLPFLMQKELIFLEKRAMFWIGWRASGDKWTTGAPGPMSNSYKGQNVMFHFRIQIEI